MNLENIKYIAKSNAKDVVSKKLSDSTLLKESLMNVLQEARFNPVQHEEVELGYFDGYYVTVNFWDNEQGCAIHDHNQVAGTIFVLYGGVQNFLYKEGGEFLSLLQKDSYKTCESFFLDENAIHSMKNINPKDKAITLHLYQRKVSAVNIFHLELKQKYFIPL